jgi:lipid II:glycine glycyltransferase (peptidoglycan interpeptide bridge formation enzyme)
MASDINEMVDVQVDIGILKTQVLTLSALCNKMDVVIEKLVDQHDRHIAKVYADMDQRRLETEKDIKEIHERIDTVLDKMQDSNEKIMEEFKSLRKDMSEHNRKEKESLDKLLEWKLMLAGCIIFLSYLISHVNFDTLLHLAK